jgi:3',5'-cyclic AMP phosphodiesterase CpdA
MRIAIVSYIHGNRAAFDAVLADLRQTSPDLILHSGDLAHGGASPAEIADRARDAELDQVYSPLGQPIAIYAHIHGSY